MSKKLSVVMLVGRDKSSNIMYHALKDEFEIEKVIMEEAVSKKKMILNRMKRLGVIKVFGQVLFILYSKVSAKLFASRIEEIKRLYTLDDSPIDDKKIIYVENVNEEKVIDLLQEINADAVIVNGTRIISAKVLACIEKPFINTHAGITPKYRGVHGGYWALANGNREHCGVTVHLVDTGIDTGGILYQDVIVPTPKDNFNTYPLLQVSNALPLMQRALEDIASDSVKPIEVDLPSQLYYHPTLWEYTVNYVMKGVK